MSQMHVDGSVFPQAQDFAIAFKPVAHGMAVVLVALSPAVWRAWSTSAPWSALPLIPAPLPRYPLPIAYLDNPRDNTHSKRRTKVRKPVLAGQLPPILRTRQEDWNAESNQ